MNRISIEYMQDLIEEIRNSYPELEQQLLFLVKDSAQAQLEADKKAILKYLDGFTFYKDAMGDSARRLCELIQRWFEENKNEADK